MPPTMSEVFSVRYRTTSAGLAVIGEYDTDWFSYRLRAAPTRSWRVDLTLTDSRAIGGSVSYLGLFP